VVTVELTLRVGTAVGDIEQANERIAAALRVAVVRVERERNDASRVTLSIVLRDPFVGGSTGCPWVTTPEMSLWQPIPIGVAETGAPVLLNLVERNLLVGGEPNGGKSKVLQLITAAAALDPEVTLWLFDAKRVELGRWQPVAASFCGPDTSAATALLDSLRREMERRYELLEAGHRRKVDPAAGMGLHVVVVDELMLYLTDPDKKAAQSFANSLRDLVARGRAAGIIVVAATQKPSTDVVPSSLRDLIAYRFALRCATRDASDTILGSGWAAEGYSASDVDPAQRGVGFLLHEGGVPMRLRAYYLSDHELDCLVVQARSVRAR
jgi:DNA segregation ATPase FtsK/SpoIIIE-like protein